MTQPVGLRERKKARTRKAIREQALRLFASHGYHATTVEQIAAAAEISPATFFRYFPTKEDVILRDDLDLVALSAFDAQPAELGPVAAYRAAAAATFAALTPADLEELADNVQLALSIPEVRSRVVGELARTIDTLAEAITRRAARSGPVPDEATARSTAGAIVGVVMAATLPGHDTPDPQSIARRIDAGLRCLELGLPQS